MDKSAWNKVPWQQRRCAVGFCICKSVIGSREPLWSVLTAQGCLRVTPVMSPCQQSGAMTLSSIRGKCELHFISISRSYRAFNSSTSSLPRSACKCWPQYTPPRKKWLLLCRLQLKSCRKANWWNPLSHQLSHFPFQAIKLSHFLPLLCTILLFIHSRKHVRTSFAHFASHLRPRCQTGPASVDEKLF